MMAEDGWPRRAGMFIVGEAEKKIPRMGGRTMIFWGGVGDG